MLNNSFYRVTITAAGLGGATPADGFIDSETVPQYMAANSNTPPDTLAHSTAKVRANVRYREVVDQIQLMANGFISNIVKAGADVDSEAASFIFTASFERDEFVTTADESNPGATLTGVDAVKRCVARAMIINHRTVLREVYDPTQSAGLNNASTTNFARNPTPVLSVVVDQLAADIATAEMAVGVSLIASVDLAS